ncbi:helix-turn-helix domain-containing protein [Streptomyces albireticuli]|uniref:helix-turn-helix domain-containing protein n=1 Tax=Streptomyces albireticuli TaxID=1940 RepID=UPI003674569B
MAAAIRNLRLASGLSGERLALRCGMSQSKVSRIETGRTLPSATDVQQILNALSVDDDTQEELISLARTANAEYQDVRASVRRGLHHRQRELASLETNAKRIRFFMPTLVTGLLQVPEYMRAAMSPPVDPAGGDVSRAVALKLERQSLLHDKSKRLEFMLTESAIRWRLCEPSVMALQLDHLVSVSRIPHVRLGVLPLSAPVREGAYHTFTVYDRALVTIEMFTGRVVLLDPKDIDHYQKLYSYFSERAAFDDDARSLLQGWAEDFRADG